jgi:hypothetical protein
MCFGTLLILWNKSYDGVLDKTECCCWWYIIIAYRKFFSHSGACVRIGLNTRPSLCQGKQAFGPGACGRIVLTVSQSMRPPLYAEPLVQYTDHVTGGLPRKARLVRWNRGSWSCPHVNVNFQRIIK